MVAIPPPNRRSPSNSRRFPLDYLGAAALIWAGGFMVLAFVLSYWLR
jgi:hypothetical protein